MKDIIKNAITNLTGELEGISKFLFENPELGNEEFNSSALLKDYLKSQGFTVEENFCGMETAFKAVYKSKIDGPAIAFLCEYDALPGIGHGCGHNLIAAMGVGGAVGLKSVLDHIGGSIMVYGTPAEETNGGKVIMAEKGAFKGISAAILTHPSGVTKESGRTLAMHAFQFEFIGKTAHAAGCPEKGINALDAVISTFNNINTLRQYIGGNARIHGIISEGGKAPNIIPDYAVAKFYVRAANKTQLEEISEKVINCAKSAALSTGATLNVSNFEFSNYDLRTNKTLSDIYTENLKSLGETEIESADAPSGSSDMGNVSYQAPCIHPMISIGSKDLTGHSIEFANCTQSEKGKSALFKGACAMALTGYDVITSTELLSKIEEEFKIGL